MSHCYEAGKLPVPVRVKHAYAVPVRASLAQLVNFEIMETLINRFFILNDYKLSYQIWSFYVFFLWFEKNKNYINS